jgi:hypothetical protein
MLLLSLLSRFRQGRDRPARTRTRKNRKRRRWHERKWYEICKRLLIHVKMTRRVMRMSWYEWMPAAGCQAGWHENENKNYLQKNSPFSHCTFVCTVFLARRAKGCLCTRNTIFILHYICHATASDKIRINPNCVVRWCTYDMLQHEKNVLCA